LFNHHLLLYSLYIPGTDTRGDVFSPPGDIGRNRRQGLLIICFFFKDILSLEKNMRTYQSLSTLISQLGRSR